MIVVLGSRHDQIAVDLSKRWPDASLCSAEDLTRPGWTWPVSPGDTGMWVTDGNIIPDQYVTGVFLRRSTVHAAELTSTHPDDRAYLAAETHAFLVLVLARTAAIVVNPVDQGGLFGESALRPERWMAAAADAGVDVAPLRVRSSHRPRLPEPATTIEVVGTETVGDAPDGLAGAAVDVCGRLELRWAVTSFDGRGRLSAITTASPPSGTATVRLGRLLSGAGAGVIVVWGSVTDEPVARVLETLASRSVPTEHLDDGTIPSLKYDLSIAPQPSGWFEIDNRRIHLEQIDAVYLRPGEQTGGGSSVSAALLAVMGGLPATVVNRPVAGRSNHSKPFQLALIASAGLATPETLVTTDPAAARAFLDRHGRIVYKSISGIRSVVSAIDRAHADRLDRIGHGPVQLQRWIDGIDIRVHVVGDRWFATSVTSDATDYRYAGPDDARVALAPFTIPTDLGRHLVAVTRGLGLVVSGIDLRRTSSGDWFCFEVNPSPGFTYYEDHTGQPIAGAIADVLSQGYTDA